MLHRRSWEKPDFDIASASLVEISFWLQWLWCKNSYVSVVGLFCSLILIGYSNLKITCKIWACNSSFFPLFFNCFYFHYTVFYKKHTFWLQLWCVLTLSQIQPKMFLRCFLKINIISSYIQGDTKIFMIFWVLFIGFRCLIYLKKIHFITVINFVK